MEDRMNLHLFNQITRDQKIYYVANGGIVPIGGEI